MIYLDNAASSWPKPPQVITSMYEFLQGNGANPGRSAHSMSITAGRTITQTREVLARLFRIKNPLRIALMANATMALNTALHGILDSGDHVVTTSLEHNSVTRPLRLLEGRGVVLGVVPAGPQGEIDPDWIAKAIKPTTRMIVATHASNVTGSLAPIREIGRIAREREILFLVDAAQTAGSFPIDVEQDHIDLLAFTGHKSLLGPQGTGGLYVREGIALSPLLQGGTGSNSELDCQPAFWPDRLESGTPNTVGIAGLGAAVDFILEQGLEQIRSHERKLMDQLVDGLSAISTLKFYGPRDADRRVALLSFRLGDWDPALVGTYLDEEYGIAVRAGLHCSPWAHRTIATFPRGTVRVSPGPFNSHEDIRILVDALERLAALTT